MTDDPKNPQQAKIRPGLPARRDAASYQTQRDIVIPAGTILRDIGDGKVGCDIGIGLITVHGKFSVEVKAGNGDLSSVLKLVIAS